LKKRRLPEKNSRALFFYDCGGAAGILIASAGNADLKQFAGKTLDDVVKAWKKSPEDTLMDFARDENSIHKSQRELLS